MLEETAKDQFYTQHRLDDHDLLIELKTRLEDLRTDIRELKEGIGIQIVDHEKRIKALEISNSRYLITVTLYSIAVASMIGLIIYHILQ